MSNDNVINHTRRTISSHGFFSSGILQILAWPLLCLILAVGLWYWTISKIDAEKRECEKKVLAEVTALCNDYAQYLIQSIEQANQITLQLQYAWEQSHEKINLQELSQSGLFRNPQINNVILVNREGRPVTAGHGKVQNISFTDRDFFIYHKNDDSKALMIGKPLVSRTTGKPAIPFSRRLNTPHGEFDGVALTGFDPHYLTAFYAGAFPGRTGVLMVAGRDGALRSATIGSATRDSMSVALRAVPLFNTPEGASYLNGERWFGDKLSRYVAWKTLEEYPLVAMVGLSQQEYFAPYQKSWATDRRVAISGSIILLLFALAAAGMSTRLVRKKHQEEEVRKAYRIATEGGSEGYYMYEALHDKSGAIVDFVLVDCNERGAEFYGIPQTQFLRKKLSGLYPAAYFDEVMNIFHGAMASGFYEDETRTPRESKLQIEWSKRRLVRSGNALAVTVQDISERKRAEDDLRRMNERFVLATHAGLVGVWDWDVPKNKLVWDDSMYRLYGIQRGDFGEAYDAWTRTIHPEDKARTDNEVQAALRGEREYAPEFRIVRLDGTVRHIKADSQTFLDDDGKPVRMIGTNIDITEHKQAEEKIRMLNQELEQRVAERTAQLEAANRELEAFCYSVSHDLRAPLRHIDGYVELLVSRCHDGLSEKGLHYLDTIAASARQMGYLIDDLLQFSRTGRAEMRHEPMDMNQALRDVLAPLQESCSGRVIEWVIEELPQVRGDFALLRQVWANLLGNSAKYTRTREATRIEVSSRAGDDETIFVVADNGVGFDMQYAGKLFGVFQRLHSQEEFEGTGIGLATVKRIIDRHGGRVWAEAEPDKGATFYFSLPTSKEAHHV